MKTINALMMTAAAGLFSLGAWADDTATASTDTPQRGHRDKRNTVWIIGATRRPTTCGY